MTGRKKIDYNLKTRPMSNPIMILPIVGNHTPVKIDHHDSKQASNIYSYKPGKAKCTIKIVYVVN